MHPNSFCPEPSVRKLHHHTSTMWLLKTITDKFNSNKGCSLNKETGLKIKSSHFTEIKANVVVYLV